MCSPTNSTEDRTPKLDVAICSDGLLVRRTYTWRTGSSARSCSSCWHCHRIGWLILRGACRGYVRYFSSPLGPYSDLSSFKKRGYAVFVLLYRQGNR
jgi:hypothetical protein